MYKVVKNGDHSDPYKVSIIADSPEDLNNMETSNMTPGSSCAILDENPKLYILGNDGTWHKI